jgi:hypothetical protein
MRKLSLLAALAAFIFPTTASAQSLDIGWAYWNTYTPEQTADIQQTCAPSQIKVVWTSFNSAPLNGCRIGKRYMHLGTWLQNDPERACYVATHEYGHLIGYGHTTRNNNIMRGSDFLGFVPWEATRSRAERPCAGRFPTKDD